LIAVSWFIYVHFYNEEDDDDPSFAGVGRFVYPHQPINEEKEYKQLNDQKQNDQKQNDPQDQKHDTQQKKSQ